MVHSYRAYIHSYVALLDRFIEATYQRVLETYTHRCHEYCLLFLYLFGMSPTV
jgi:hypothetical protein